jgi:aminopeptidase N
MNIKSFIAAASLVAVVACDTNEQAKSTDDSQLPPLPHDTQSYAQPEKARVTNVSLDLTPDFTSRRINGIARLAIQKAQGADSLILDVRDIDIKRVTDAKGDSLGYRIGESKEVLGAPLAIALPSEGDTVVIEYQTRPEAAAAQWLSAEQTAGGKLPFLLTQGEAILTRTWIPTQDGPGIRQTYEATVHVPVGMRAVMSAEHVGMDGEKDEKGLSVYRFRMTHPIPPYLIALAVGDIAFRPIGKNTGIYAEPSVVDRAANEFAEVDKMVAAAEKLYGPYRWGRYDILVLPPSFPYGGMENPTLTFATPTVLAGDRSLVSLVAHELAHSWSGNLVTNATWEDFWLNEGFTTYIESRIMEELRGKNYADMLRLLGRQDLEEAMKPDGGGQSPDTRLHLDLAGKTAEDAMSDIAYEKGSAFLQTVESVVGRERLDKFLRDYFDHFAFQPMSADRMVAYMKQKLLTPEEVQKINVQQWVYEPGLPSNAPVIKSEAFTAVEKQVDSWKSGAAASTLTTANWSTQEWLHFLHALPDTIPAARLDDLDKTFKLSSSGNSEIQFAWFKIAIANHYEPAFGALEQFLLKQGRRKFVAPLYADLAAKDWGKPIAMRIYAKARPTYHSVSTGTIDKTLGVKK